MVGLEKMGLFLPIGRVVAHAKCGFLCRKTEWAIEEGWVFNTSDIWNGEPGLGPPSEFDMLNLDSDPLNQT